MTLKNAKVFDLGLGQFYQNKLEPFSEDHPGLVVQNIFRTPLWKLRAWTRLENWLPSWAFSWEKLCSSRKLRYFSSCLCAYDWKKVAVSKHAGSIKNKTKQKKLENCWLATAEPPWPTIMRPSLKYPSPFELPRETSASNPPQQSLIHCWIQWHELTRRYHNRGSSCKDKEQSY